MKNRKFASALRTYIFNQALYWKIEEERGCHYSVRQRYHCNEFPNIGPALSATLARFALYTGGERVLLHKSWIAQKRFICSSIVEWSFKIAPSVVHFFKICVLQFIFNCNIRDTHCALLLLVSIWLHCNGEGGAEDRDRYLFVHQPCNQPLLQPAEGEESVRKYRDMPDISKYLRHHFSTFVIVRMPWSKYIDPFYHRQVI